LVLLLCGTLRPDLIGTRKTSNHTLSQFQRLNSEIADLGKHISLPNILTEASNHLGAGKQQPIEDSAHALSLYVLNLDEIYQPSKEVVKISEYMNVGLADAAIISCLPRLKKEKVRVFTQDWQLYNRLAIYDVDCVNIMHWATPAKYYKT
jgi:hypothetical protein